MPSLIFVGQKLQEVDILDLIPAYEGEINQYYGKIGSGKTYTATADVLNDLKNGQVVYVNWDIKWEGYDERQNKWLLFLGWLGLKKMFYIFPKENLRKIEIDENFTDTLSRLTDCIIYLDEGHLAFDSYEMAKMKIEKRTAILHTRHFNRTINIISQRASAIHITLRANVNRYYKIENLTNWFWQLFKITRFKKSEYQELTAEEKPDETLEPEYTQIYYAKNEIFEAYSTKYLRKGLEASQKNYGEVYELNRQDCWKALRS